MGKTKSSNKQPGTRHTESAPWPNVVGKENPNRGKPIQFSISFLTLDTWKAFQDKTQE